jgi:hypothetical protein
VAQGREAHLHHVVAAACAVEQRAEEHVHKYGAGGDAERDAVDAFGGEPQVRQQPVQAGALVRDHVGHVGAEHRVCDEDGRQNRHRPADRAAGGFQQQQQASAGNDDVLQVRLARPRGQLTVEEQQVGAREGADERHRPVGQRHMGTR